MNKRKELEERRLQLRADQEVAAKEAAEQAEVQRILAEKVKKEREEAAAAEKKVKSAHQTSLVHVWFFCRIYISELY